MKILARILVISIILLATSCARQAPDGNLSGKWRGYITERGKSTLVELTLRDQQGSIGGTFTILSETGEDVDQGAAFDIVLAERSGNELKFTVPIAGKVDDDAIAFELLVQRNSLKGYGHELREGSKNLPITFARHE